MKFYLMQKVKQKVGISHGRMISPTYFLLKINEIVAQFPTNHRYRVSLYVDNPRPKGREKIATKLKCSRKFA